MKTKFIDGETMEALITGEGSYLRKPIKTLQLKEEKIYKLPDKINAAMNSIDNNETEGTKISFVVAGGPESMRYLYNKGIIDTYYHRYKIGYRTTEHRGYDLIIDNFNRGNKVRVIGLIDGKRDDHTKIIDIEIGK